MTFPRILIVDDDPDTVESMRLILESRSYEVITAGTAEEGLQRARAERPDLILLDVMMPQ
ncbi:MAG: response regulator, partial [Candidatus Tectomicrobia bacterium]|nr:response regulator [Candidatus Tectomicrobia bacterium]